MSAKSAHSNSVRPENSAGSVTPGVAPRLSGIDTWVFDLDNTLYPSECNLFAQIDVRMTGFIANLLGVDKEKAFVVQKRYFKEHGTTLRGLMDNHGIIPEDFLSYVHDIDVTAVDPNPDLASALADLPGRRLVFTNGSVPHAQRVMDRLGISHVIEDVFDIAAADYHPKPRLQTYERFVSHYDINPKSSAMFEDMVRNLTPAAELGMTTVWLRSCYSYGALDHRAESVHYEIDDLVSFLKAQQGG